MSVQKITFEVRVGGRLVPHVTEVTTSAGFDQVNASASWSATEKPSWADEGQSVTIWAKNTGTAEGQIFGGELQAETWSYTPGQVTMEGRDVLARTRLSWGGDDYEYAEQDDAAIIRNLLEKMGIPSSMASIESSGWTLGIIEPILLKEGTAPYSIIQSIDDLAGYKTYSLTTGVIVRRRVSGMAGSGGALTFSKGVTILSGARRQRSRDGIVNRSVVTGLSYEGLLIGGPGVAEYQASNPYIPDPPAYITEAVQSNLVEDDDKALEIATRIVTDKNRRPEQIEFSVPLDPRVQPGMTVVVNHADLEISGTPLFVLHVEHRISASGATTAIRAIGGALGVPPTIPPVAQFAINTVLEAEDTGSGVEARVLVNCDGSSSYDPDGTIVSYAWTIAVTGGTASPTSGSGAVFTSLLSGSPTEVVVTLTVTDNDSLTGELVLTQAIENSALPVEDLYMAAGDMYASSDGEQTWRQVTPASGSATCLMPLAMAEQVWGTTSGHLYASWDVLATAPIDLGAPHGAVACTAVWIHEDDPTRLWAAFADGDVWQASVDQSAHTATWTRRGNVGAGPVVEIRESVGTLNELRATANSGYYYSITGGASWALQHTFDTAWRMAAGFDRNLAGGLNSTPPIYSEVDTAPTVPSGVTHIRGLSFGYRTQELYAADNAAHLYLGAGPSFDLSLHADSTAAIVNHMIRSGNLDRVVYAAVGDGTGANGAQKWLPGVRAPFFIKRTGSSAARMVGFGALHTPAVTFDLLLPATFADNSSDLGIWRYTGGAWAQRSSGLPAGMAWVGVYANPANRDEWLALGNKGWSGQVGSRIVGTGVSGTLKTLDSSQHVLWHTADAGASWSAVPLTGFGSTAQVLIRHTGVAWDSAGGTWAIVSREAGTGTPAFITRGSGGTASAAVAFATGTIDSMITYGQDGDVETQRGQYIDASNTVQSPPGSMSSSALVLWRLGTGRNVVAMVNADLYGTADYRAARPSSILTGIASTENSNYLATMAATIDGAVYVGNRTDGVLKVSNVFGAPTSAVVAAAGYPIGAVRAGRQRNVAVAALITSFAGGIMAYNGTAWTFVNIPTAAGFGAFFVEVIE